MISVEAFLLGSWVENVNNIKENKITVNTRLIEFKYWPNLYLIAYKIFKVLMYCHV
jgi:hypothetical protein